jgi:N utilization substance protein B
MKEDVLHIVEGQESTMSQSVIEAIAYNDLSRRDVRALIFYLLYAAEAFDYQESLAAIVDNFNRGFDLDIPHDSEVVRIAQAVINDRDQLDEIFKPLLANWRFERIGVSTRLILRFATWELTNTDTDSRIVINEAVELAKAFAEKDAYKFVNGVLDRLVKKKVEEPT